MNPIDQLIHSTVRLECSLINGSTSVGTAFVFSFKSPQSDSWIPVFVTNKHVVKGAIIGNFLLTSSKDEMPNYGDFIQFSIPDFENQWIFHPDNNIDLCIMPIAQILNNSNKIPYIVGFSELDIITSIDLNELTAFEEIFMIGYPNSLWDESNNLPIIRKGITATHAKFNYNGKNEFMIDAACFPGSSGSPVYMNMSGLRRNNDGGMSLLMGEQIKLLGILYAGPMFDVNGKVDIVDIPTVASHISFSSIPMNLGYVIKIEKLLEMKELLFNSIRKPFFRW
ncbi:trypsin-like peptidase domain-containing protein [Aggregatibacter actinomycetemcomitans]|nr:trypsin-like peptidase domain-containing protein [Aggregatibacter actinomycetemcomitans]